MLHTGYRCFLVAGFLLLDAASAMAQTIPPKVPDVSLVASKGHPRTIKHPSLNPEVLQLLADQAKRNAQATSLLVEPDASQLTSSSSAEAAQASAKVAALAGNESDRLLTSAFYWLITGDGTAQADAKRRALNLATFSPRGATGLWYQDQAARSLAWSLALVYDWMYSQWTIDERKRLVNAIAPRVEDILGKPVSGYPTGWAALDGGTKLDRSPYDSHGVTTLSLLAVICSAMAGEAPEFDRCFEQVVPRYVARPIPWGGEDGGFANGTAYAQWGLQGAHYAVWDLLKNATGVDLWQTNWARNHLTFLAYFLPPGTPTGEFGDAAERRMAEDWATEAKIYASHLVSPLADWYAKNQFGERNMILPMWLSPFRQWDTVPGQIPQGTPSAAYIPSIGWVAMHSALGDRARTSVYFKSSPFGSFSHSHADQNSFVVNARGRALAIDSGYYDYYGSPHWTDWYQQTRAHNAITYDGGQGQIPGSLDAKGRISKFEHHPDYDIATGDAVVAYGRALSRALRTLVYLPPDILIVSDSLLSDVPRTWEWNIHALSSMKQPSTHSLEIDNNGTRLCVNLLQAPEGSFSQADRFTTEPKGTYPAQWHARYSSSTKTNAARFVAALDVECSRPPIDVSQTGTDFVIKAKGHELRFADNGEVTVK